MLARVPDGNLEPDQELSGSDGVRRAWSRPVRLGLGLLFSVAVWAFLLAATAQAAGGRPPTAGQPDTGTAAETVQPAGDQPLPEDGASPVDEVPDDPSGDAEPPADGDAVAPPEQPPPGGDGEAPPDSGTPSGAGDVPPTEGEPSGKPDNGPDDGRPHTDCQAPAAQDEPSTCPDPAEPPPTPEQPAGTDAPDPAPSTAPPTAPPVVVDEIPLPEPEPVEVVEEATEDVVDVPLAEPVPTDVCDASTADLGLTSIVDLAPALPCAVVDLPVVAVDDLDAPDPGTCVTVALTLDAAALLPPPIGSGIAAPLSAMSAAATDLTADGTSSDAAVSDADLSPNRHVPGHLPGPGAPTPMPAAPPAPTAAGSGGACGGPGLRRDGGDSGGDQVAVTAGTTDLGVPTAAEESSSSAPADAVLAREADPRFRPD
jgi:hypothetical protein